jgi:hypothetical protein
MKTVGKIILAISLLIFVIGTMTGLFDKEVPKSLGETNCKNTKDTLIIILEKQK